MREPQRQGPGSSRVRVRPADHAEPKTQSAADARRRLDDRDVVGEAANIRELLRGVPFN